MINLLVGNVVEGVEADGSICLLANGVGYRVNVTDIDRDLLNVNIGKQELLFVRTVIRETSHTLYGFRTRETRQAFERICDVDGVGPATALGILSVMSPEVFDRAVRDANHKALVAIPRVGPKMAVRLISELGK